MYKKKAKKVVEKKVTTPEEYFYDDDLCILFDLPCNVPITPTKFKQVLKENIDDFTVADTIRHKLKTITPNYEIIDIYCLKFINKFELFARKVCDIDNYYVYYTEPKEPIVHTLTINL